MGTLNELTAVLPTLNAADTLADSLAALRNQVAAIVIADGGSNDATAAVAAAEGARVVAAPRGRGSQLAAGTAAVATPWILVLHADTHPGPGWQDAARAFMADPANARRAAYFPSPWMMPRRRRGGSNAWLPGAAAVSACPMAIRGC